MSERKTAEIKFRVAPSEKARWQADAERLETPLSELIRKRMNEVAELRAQAQAVLQAVPAPPVVYPQPWAADNTASSYAYPRTETQSADVAPRLSPESEQALSLEGAVPPVPIESLLDEDDLSVIRLDASPQEDVSTSDEVGACEEPTGLAAFISTNTTEVGPPLSRELLEKQFGLVTEKPRYPWQFNA